ncbi:MAG: hypothetical protein B6U76_11130 [Desulfurococcales archaeon ex4484_217_2]|nr:MAG: hypothetical protein B6U76_11130 [Desulfurococcales archaeon ex4484_217_2]
MFSKRLKEILSESEEAKRIRASSADWVFINSQPPRIREALKYYIETGDIRRSCTLAGKSIEEFRELLRKARIPVVV